MQTGQVSGHNNFAYARYAKKLFTQIYRDFMRMGTNMAAGNQQKHLSLSFSRNSKTLK